MNSALDPQAASFIAEVDAAGVPPVWELAPATARALQQNFVPRMSGPEEAVAQVRERNLPESAGAVRVRIYVPETPLGILVWFHGGGWVIGSLNTADAACRALANATPCAVVSVGYRLAPEHRFPAAYDDALAAARWALENASRIGAPPHFAVGGDSAGATLAASVALALRASNPPLRLQLLVYPALHPEPRGPCAHAYGTGCLLTTHEARWYWTMYLSKPDDAKKIEASPLSALTLRRAPPAFLIQAECDPVRDDGTEYAARLHADGVAVETRTYSGLIHGFFTMPGVMARAREAYADAASALRGAFL